MAAVAGRIDLKAEPSEGSEEPARTDHGGVYERRFYHDIHRVSDTSATSVAWALTTMLHLPLQTHATSPHVSLHVRLSHRQHPECSSGGMVSRTGARI